MKAQNRGVTLSSHQSWVSVEMWFCLTDSPSLSGETGICTALFVLWAHEAEGIYLYALKGPLIALQILKPRRTVGTGCTQQLCSFIFLPGWGTTRTGQTVSLLFTVSQSFLFHVVGSSNSCSEINYKHIQMLIKNKRYRSIAHTE